MEIFSNDYDLPEPGSVSIFHDVYKGVAVCNKSIKEGNIFLVFSLNDL